MIKRIKSSSYDITLHFLGEICIGTHMDDLDFSPDLEMEHLPMIMHSLKIKPV